MKHAYLIIAHNEYTVLNRLIHCLDDERNDIYVHIDKKAEFDGKSLSVTKSCLFILPEHLDGRWGDFSLVRIEYLLFETAYKKSEYAYYHLLSGVDFPIKSQDYIHDYCKRNQGVEFVGIAGGLLDRELRWRSQHYFLFSREFKTTCYWKRLFRALFVVIQSIVGYKRSSLEIKKGSQWCSVTHCFVSFLLQHKNIVEKIFNHTYCPDEMFIQTLLWNSDFKYKMYNIHDEFEGCKRYIKWDNGQLLPIDEHDVVAMVNSDKWFARKFSSDKIELINLIEKYNG